MKRNSNEIKFNGGVLIIGSLMWEESKIREEWRRNNLDVNKSKLINLPIRYGRISQSRNCTHSMIFSSECKVPDKIGKGYFIPFKEEMTIGQILEQGKFMIDAEHNRVTKLTRFNWGWGCLGIAFNPRISEDKLENFSSRWSEKYGNGFNPNQYKIGEEEPVVSKEGCLKIDWQDELEETEFIIGTATKPNVKEYPRARKIAQKMLVNEYDLYYRNNQNVSIKTFQDEEIELEINKLSKVKKDK